MPFKSEKQRRYLWANEPEIARDWTDTYGSRIQKNSGGISQLVKPGPGRPGYSGVLDRNIANLEAALAYSDLTPEERAQTEKDLQKAKEAKGTWKDKALAGDPVEEVEESEVLEPDLTKVKKMSMIPSWEDLKYNLERLAEPGMEKFDTWEGTQAQLPFEGARSFNLVPTPSEESLMMGDVDAGYGLHPQEYEPTPPEGIMKAGGYPADANYIPRETMANWGELDDLEAQQADAQRQMQLARLANMQQYPPTEEDESGNWLARFKQYAMPAYNFMRGNVATGLMGLVNPLAALTTRFAGGKNLKDSRFYRGATTGARGYTPQQLNSMNALGGYYSDPARQQRRTQSRIQNMLARKAAGKSYSQKNLDALTGNQVLIDIVPTVPKKTRRPVGPPPGGGPHGNGGGDGGGRGGGGGQAAADAAGGSSMHSPFNRGGLAGLWRR